MWVHYSPAWFDVLGLACYFPSFLLLLCLDVHMLGKFLLCFVLFCLPLLLRHGHGITVV